METSPQDEGSLVYEPIIIGSGVPFTEEVADIIRNEQRRRGLSTVNRDRLASRATERRPKPVPVEPADIGRMVHEVDAEMRRRADIYVKKLLAPLDIATEL